MTDAHKIYTAWTQMWNGHLDIADELLSPHFKAHLTADSTPPPAPVTDIASAQAWIATIRRQSRYGFPESQRRQNHRLLDDE